MAGSSLNRTLIKNYVVFVLIMLAVAFSTLLILGLMISSTMSREETPKITANDTARPDYGNVDISDIKLMGGWVEVLDEDNKVIFTKGGKKTDTTRYSSEQLYQMISYDGSGHGYICTAKEITADGDRHYVFLVFIPSDKAELTLNLINAPLPLPRKFISILIASLIIFLCVFTLNIFLFSKWTAGKIGMPLSNITGAIRKMSGGNLGIRMDFKAENEFLQIRDAFNDMASRLEASQIEKNRLEEARKRMFVDISHDLKTPITVISGYSKALAEHMVNDETQKQRYIDTIYNKSMRVSELIDDLFELSRLESGRPELKLEPTDMVEFIKGIAAEYYEQFEEKNLLLELDIPDRRILCRIDRKQITRAISNLLTNAIRYNTAGTTIRIGLSENAARLSDTAGSPAKTNTGLSETAAGLSIEISDNGTGIPENLRDTIFEPFVRGDVSRHSDGGTGLGLAIARSIVLSHGGSLRLVSESGLFKTSFILELPFR
ncbi:MAG TPA: HAMP domain-containing sensor histidine kinase [Clostridia bacterium]|nr:HAMP domain-containing sensor histidine kinase [Clostridia bacterium]